MKNKVKAAKKTGIAIILGACLLLLSFCTACGSASQSASADSSDEEILSATVEFYAMDTIHQIVCYGPEAQEAADAAQAEITRIDELFSVGNAESEVAQINANGGGSLSDDGLSVLSSAFDIYNTTDGAFDITIYPLMELWGFTTESYYVPEQEELDAYTANVGMDKLTVDSENKTVTLSEGQGIDYGGIAKGYTADRLSEIFSEYDIVSAKASLGGNVLCWGTKPDGSLWKVGIENPELPEEDIFDTENIDADAGTIALIVSVADENVVTSGGYERYFTDEATGEVYYHILDPKTGAPVKTDVVSSTIVTQNGVYADALSTATFVMGKDKSVEYWRTYKDVYDFEMILLCSDGYAYVTEGLQDIIKDKAWSSVIVKADE